tara:strand:- start:342 stop:1136 length:795 start_codon:yes stop_codon:yes gene_type:complete
MSEIVLSVICCTARKNPGLKELVESLEQQGLPKELFELVYCDKYDRSEFKKILSESNLNYQYLKEKPSGKEGQTISSARNQAVDSSRGEYIVNVDDLITLYPDTLANHLQLFEDGFDAIAGFSDFVHEERFHEDEPNKQDERGNLPRTSPMAAMHFYGYHCGFKKEFWAKVGGYDETFDGVYGWEDIDFGIRMHRAGATICFAPHVRVNQVRDDTHEDLVDVMITNKGSKIPRSIMQGEVRWRNDKLHAMTLTNYNRIGWRRDD